MNHVAVLPRGLRVAEPGPLDQIPIDIHVCGRVGVALNRGLLVQNAFRAHKVGIEQVLSAKLARVLRLELAALKKSKTMKKFKDNEKHEEINNRNQGTTIRNKNAELRVPQTIRGAREAPAP